MPLYVTAFPHVKICDYRELFLTVDGNENILNFPHVSNCIHAH